MNTDAFLLCFLKNEKTPDLCALCRTGLLSGMFSSIMYDDSTNLETEFANTLYASAETLMAYIAGNGCSLNFTSEYNEELGAVPDCLAPLRCKTPVTSQPCIISRHSLIIPS